MLRVCKGVQGGIGAVRRNRAEWNFKKFCQVYLDRYIYTTAEPVISWCPTAWGLPRSKTRPGRSKHLRPQTACGSQCWCHISPGDDDDDDDVHHYDDDDDDDGSYWGLWPGSTPWGDRETRLQIRNSIRIQDYEEIVGGYEACCRVDTFWHVSMVFSIFR